MSSPTFAELLGKQVDDIKPVPPLPIGEYTFEIGGREEVTSTQKGTPGIEITLTAVAASDKIDKDALVDPNTNQSMVPGRQLSTTFWITEKAMPMVAEWLKLLGITGVSVAEGLLQSQGKLIIGEVTQKMSKNGRIYNEITQFRAIA